MSVINNIDILATICSFLARKKKFSVRQMNRDFQDLVVPRAMVSLVFRLNRTLENEKYLNNCLKRFMKVGKMVLEDLKVYKPAIAIDIGQRL